MSSKDEYGRKTSQPPWLCVGKGNSVGWRKARIGGARGWEWGGGERGGRGEDGRWVWVRGGSGGEQGGVKVEESVVGGVGGEVDRNNGLVGVGEVRGEGWEELGKAIGQGRRERLERQTEK